MNKKPEIYGFNKSSEAGLDKFAFSVFLKGCNLRCPYCMNYSLVEDKSKIDLVDLNIIEESILKEKPKMIVISGGEPTYNLGNLYSAITWIRGIKSDIKIAVSTNGIDSYKIEELLEMRGYIDYIIMDLKSDPAGYKLLSSNKINSELNSFFQVMNSWRFIRENIVDHEVRTTLYPNLVGTKEILFMSRLFNAGERWVLQQFRNNTQLLGNCSSLSVVPYSEFEVANLLSLAKENSLAEVSIRYV